MLALLIFYVFTRKLHQSSFQSVHRYKEQQNKRGIVSASRLHCQLDLITQLNALYKPMQECTLIWHAAMRQTHVNPAHLGLGILPHIKYYWVLCKTGNKNNEYVLQGEYDLLAITFYVTIFFTYITVLSGISKIKNRCIIQADLDQGCCKLNTCKRTFWDKRVRFIVLCRSYDIIIFI